MDDSVPASSSLNGARPSTSVLMARLPTFRFAPSIGLSSASTTRTCAVYCVAPLELTALPATVALQSLMLSQPPRPFGASPSSQPHTATSSATSHCVLPHCLHGLGSHGSLFSDPESLPQPTASTTTTARATSQHERKIIRFPRY